LVTARGDLGAVAGDDYDRKSFVQQTLMPLDCRALRVTSFVRWIVCEWVGA
jgi:hypothetical protein